MATHDKIFVVCNINIRDVFLDACPKQIQGLPLVWANARDRDLSSLDRREHRCVVVYIGFDLAYACLVGVKGSGAWTPRGNYDFCRRVF